MDDKQLQLIRSYLENTQMSLEIAHYIKVDASWRYDFPVTDVCRLYYIREGEGWVRVRNRIYHPKPGQLLLLPAGIPLSLGRLNEDGFGKYWCHFAVKMGDVNLFQLLELPYCIDVMDESGLEKQFQSLIHYYRNPSLTSPMRIKSLLYEMVSDYVESSLAQGHRVTIASTEESGKINTVLHYVEDHLRERITVEELARLVHFHPNYFMQYFKEKMGMPLIAYINRKRMDKAIVLLNTTEFSVTRIADMVGMELYYFSRMFKKQTSLSPSEFRKYSVHTKQKGREGPEND